MRSATELLHCLLLCTRCIRLTTEFWF